jgi:N-acetylglucosamine malate deacetylase 2
MKKMLLVFAHPDDESFGTGGTVAKYVKAGWDVDLVVATRGEAGQSGTYGEVSEDELGSIRQKELEKAGKVLGISTITFLGYKDGTLAKETPGEIEDKVYQKMIELVPDVVVTFDTTGISNHPDHIRMSYATTFAFQKYASWIHERLKDHPEYKEEREPKLYYVCMPSSIVEYLKKKKLHAAESFGKPWQGVDDRKISAVINIKETLSIKKKALLCHISQAHDTGGFLARQEHTFSRQEYFILRYHGLKETFMGKNDRVSDRL